MSIIVGFVVAALIVTCAYLNSQLGRARLDTAEWRRLAVEADRRGRVTAVLDEVRAKAEADGVVLPTIKVTIPMPPVKPPRKAGRAKA